MAIYNGNKMAHEHLLNIANHCAQAALNAIQITGTVEIQTKILTDEDILPIIEIFEEIAKTEAYFMWNFQVYKAAYDAGTPPVLLLIGADLTQSETNWNCGACGFNSCLEFNKYSRENKKLGACYVGPVCNWRTIDYGIACDWACAAAHQYNIENRLQSSAGVVAYLLGHLENCSAVLGLPLGPCKGYWYYSYPAMNFKWSYEDWKKSVLHSVPVRFTGFTGGGRTKIKTSDEWWEKNMYLKVEEDLDYDAIVAASKGKTFELIMKKRKEIEERKKLKKE